MLIKQITVAEKNEIARLLSICPNGTRSFRYFDKRPLDIIQNHIVTVICYDNSNQPIGYGHLDLEQERVWLGVLVADDMHGKGIGGKILDFLLAFAKENSIESIILSVDIYNIVAIDLYKKKGFVESGKNDYFVIYELKTSE